MGCDGGTIPRRDELVRVKKKPEQVKLWNNLNKTLVGTYVDPAYHKLLIIFRIYFSRQ